MNKRYFIASKFETAAKRLEVAIESWASYVKILHGNDACTYVISKQISSNEVWNCGIVHLRKPWKVPRKQLGSLIAPNYSEKEFRENWVELIALIRNNAKTNEVNQQDLIIETFRKSFVFPIVRSASLTSDKFVQNLWEVTGRIPEDPKVRLWVDQDNKLISYDPETMPKLPQKRGRKKHSNEELEALAEIVCKALKLKTLKRTWGQVALELGENERTLRYWRHDQRIKEILRDKECRSEPA